MPRRRHHTRICHGQVYVVHAKGTDLCKIGVVESNMQSRMVALSNAAPYPLELVAAVPCKDAREVERKTHKALAVAHAHGEWFNLDETARQLLVERLYQSKDVEVEASFAMREARQSPLTTEAPFSWASSRAPGKSDGAAPSEGWARLSLKVAPALLRQVEVASARLGIHRLTFIEQAIAAAVKRSEDGLRTRRRVKSRG